MANILLINGPNLNLLGGREPDIYGHSTLSDIENTLKKEAHALTHTLTTFQSNAEPALIETIHNAADNNTDFILINPAALTHTSVALRDALSAVALPFIEIHLSNIYAREPFRHRSYFSDIAVGVISGFGDQSYRYALMAAHHYLLQMEVQHGR